MKLVSALFKILLQSDLPLCKPTHDHHWAPRSRSLPWHLRKVETYQPSSGCDPHHTADEFRQVLPNQWMVKIFPRQISWIARRCLRSFFFVKIPPKKRSRTGNPLLCRQKCVRLTVIPGPGVSRAVFVKIHLKIEYMFLNFARDVTACTCWADLVKCCRHLISLNDLASSARMRSREMCRKSLGHRRRVP